MYKYKYVLRIDILKNILFLNSYFKAQIAVR